MQCVIFAGLCFLIQPYLADMVVDALAGSPTCIKTIGYEYTGRDADKRPTWNHPERIVCYEQGERQRNQNP